MLQYLYIFINVHVPPTVYSLTDCLQSEVRMELELKDHTYQQIFFQVASLHAVSS